MDFAGKWIEQGPNHKRDYDFKANGAFSRHGTSYWKEFDMTTEEQTEGTYSVKPEKGDTVLNLGIGKGKIETYVVQEGKCKLKGKEIKCIGLFNHNTYRTLVMPQHKVVFEVEEDHAKAKIKDGTGNVIIEGIALTKE